MCHAGQRVQINDCVFQLSQSMMYMKKVILIFVSSDLSEHFETLKHFLIVNLFTTGVRPQVTLVTVSLLGR